MKQKFTLFDFHTLELGYCGALRQLYNAKNQFLFFYVVGQTKRHLKLEKSIQKLIELGLICKMWPDRNEIDTILTTTDQGNKLYQRYLELEESGYIKKIIAKHKEKIEMGKKSKNEETLLSTDSVLKDEA